MYVLFYVMHFCLIVVVVVCMCIAVVSATVLCAFCLCPLLARYIHAYYGQQSIKENERKMNVPC